MLSRPSTIPPLDWDRTGRESMAHARSPLANRSFSYNGSMTRRLRRVLTSLLPRLRLPLLPRFLT